MSATWYVVIAVVMVLIEGRIYRKWGLSKVFYDRFFKQSAVFEGQEVQMVEKIYNRKLLPLPWLRIESKMDESLKFNSQANLSIKYGQFHKSLFTLMPYTGITRTHKIQCIKRGYYALNSVALTCGELFGMDEVSKEMSIDASLMVYPKLVPIKEIPIPSHNWQGDISVRRWIIDDPFLTSGIREYTYGDSFNQINWKATAKTGQLQVNKRDYTAQPRIIIYLNMDISEEMWDAVTDTDLIERGISYAASLASYYISQGIETGFGCNGYTIECKNEPVRIWPKNGNDQVMVILEAMAKLIIDRSITFYTFLQQDIDRGMSGYDIIIITPYISPRLQGQMDKLKAYGNGLAIVHLQNQEQGA